MATLSFRLLPAFLVAAIALVIAAITLGRSSQHVARTYATGRNNSVLFLVSEHHGLSNVHLATIQSLLEKYPQIQVHFASFPNIEHKVQRLSTLAKKRHGQAKDIIFHPLTKGPSYSDALHANVTKYDDDGLLSVIAPPGSRGVEKLTAEIQHYIDPFKAEDHLALYLEAASIISTVDPAAVVLDTLFQPAISAARGMNRLHAFITPNSVLDNFAAEQSYLKFLWKYPALASGIPYPIPWTKMPLNIFLNIKLIYAIINMPVLAEKRKFLRENGISNPIQFVGLHRSDVPWITPTLPEAAIMPDYIPPNVTLAGPITLTPASADAQDPELVRWMKRKPTVLINLGSGLTYSRNQTFAMISAIERVLEKSDLQILWKYAPPVVPFDWETAVAPLLSTGRVKVETWLKVDPPSLLQTGHIVTFVTHGGANGYYESIEAGVAQVVLPLWADLYNYAQLAESIGVGQWACREISPQWSRDCLSDAIIEVASGRLKGTAMRAKARDIGEIARAKPGRDTAADVIAQLAMSGTIE